MVVKRLAWLFLFCLLATSAHGNPVAESPPRESTVLWNLFGEAGEEFAVPPVLLIAIAIQETGLVGQPQDAESEGNPIVGVMGIRLNPSSGITLKAAAAALGVPSPLIASSRRENIRAAAAWLADRAKGSLDWIEWVQLAGDYAGLPAGANERYQQGISRLLLNGANVALRDGSQLGFKGIADADLRQYGTSLSGLIPASPGYPSADYVPACSGNFTNANRAASDIKRIVIHTVQGSYSSCVNWFANCDAQVSAHYVISKKGEITQMVFDEDIAWHAGYWEYNETSIGIEHEGFVEEPDNYTPEMMAASANLTRALVEKYNIPIDEVYILGHHDVPGCAYGAGGGKGCHTDPGEYFDWDGYLSLVSDGQWVPEDEGENEEVLPVTGDLVGFIRESDIYTGGDLPGVEVSLSSGETMVTGYDGFYAFAELEPGAIEVTAVLEGYQTVTASATVVAGQKNWKSMALEPLPEEETPVSEEGGGDRQDTDESDRGMTRDQDESEDSESVGENPGEKEEGVPETTEDSDENDFQVDVGTPASNEASEESRLDETPKAGPSVSSRGMDSRTTTEVFAVATEESAAFNESESGGCSSSEQDWPRANFLLLLALVCFLSRMRKRPPAS